MSAWNGQSHRLFVKCHLRQLAAPSLSGSHQAGPQAGSPETRCRAAVCEGLEEAPGLPPCPPRALGDSLPFSLYLSPERNPGGEAENDAGLRDGASTLLLR